MKLLTDHEIEAENEAIRAFHRRYQREWLWADFKRNWGPTIATILFALLMIGAVLLMSLPQQVAP